MKRLTPAEERAEASLVRAREYTGHERLNLWTLPDRRQDYHFIQHLIERNRIIP